MGSGERAGPHRVHLDAQVDPIQQGPTACPDSAVSPRPDRCSLAGPKARTDTG
ncbi:mg chelatase, subunit ChlI domain protein [Mycobacterium xenopi 3993]|nr:mg chelatase, subunit ChlI domain protein [Mycobacterium xenopi 3993]